MTSMMMMTSKYPVVFVMRYHVDLLLFDIIPTAINVKIETMTRKRLPSIWALPWTKMIR